MNTRNLSRMDPSYPLQASYRGERKSYWERNKAELKKTVGKIAVVAGLAAMVYGGKQMHDRPEFDPIAIPVKGEEVIVYTATPKDTGPQKIASHFESNHEEGRLDALTDLVQREANQHDGHEHAQIEPGETFVIPAQEFTLREEQ